MNKIKRLAVAKNPVKGETHFHVYYNNKTVTYTRDNVPSTVLNFMQTHAYIETGNRLIFR